MTPLRVATSTSSVDPPYPSDIRAKGWRFELDYERIEQSDTWALAPAEMRPWLLMLWLISWRQSPCGSLPNNDELIAARIGMPARLFTASRDILLRGWRLHSDGRLYHPVISEQVLGYIDHCRREARRKAEWRLKSQGASDVPPDKAGTEPVKPKRKPVGLALLLEAGIDQQVAEDWLTVRRAKNLGAATPTVMKALQREAATANISVPEAVKEAVERGWGGFKAAWLQRELTITSAKAEPGWRAEQRDRAAAFAGPAAAKPSTAHTLEALDAAKLLR